MPSVTNAVLSKSGDNASEIPNPEDFASSAAVLVPARADYKHTEARVRPRQSQNTSALLAFSTAMGCN